MEMRGRARTCAPTAEEQDAQRKPKLLTEQVPGRFSSGEKGALFSALLWRFIEISMPRALLAGPRARAAPLLRRGAPPRDEVMCVDRPIRHVADGFLIDDVIDREIDPATSSSRPDAARSRPKPELGPIRALIRVVFGSRGWLLYYELRGRDAPRMCAPCMGNTCP